MSKVLIIEDEEDIAHLIALHLKRESHEITIALNGKEGWEKIQTGNYDLALVDWMLPGFSGVEIVKKVRSAPEIQNLLICMVTAKTQSEDIVEGLDSGADDYLTKPIDLSVLKARVKALLRRLNLQEKASQKAYQWQGIKLDSESFEVTLNGNELKLTKSEFKILLALLKNQGKVLTREKLIDFVQGEGVAVIKRTIDTHMVALRKKLGEQGALIESIRGVGYRII